MTQAQVRKAASLRGRTLVLRNAVVDDAPFILALRTDARRSRHLSGVSPALSDQQDWLRHYALRPEEAYFIIEDLTGQPWGTVRLYDARGDSFSWGSWILRDDAPASAGIESALMVYAYALHHLGFQRAHFQVQRGNEGVWRFHERFGALRTGEDAQQYHYEIDADAIGRSMHRYRRYLPQGIAVQEMPA